MRTKDLPYFHKVELHSLWPEWIKWHETRILLVGGTVNGFGEVSYTYSLMDGRVLDPDTLEEIEWTSERYDDQIGYRKFLEWAQEQENGQASSEKAE